MDELKLRYNDVAAKQLNYSNIMRIKFDEFNRICEEEKALKGLVEYDFAYLRELKRQEFEQNKFGMSDSDFQDMQKTKDSAKEIMDSLLLSGVTMTGKEIREGFEVI